MKFKFCVLILLSASIATYVWVIELKMDIKARSFDEGSMCPARMAVSMDLGRIGNKFFEYMAARVISQVLGIGETFITPEFGLLYDRYFNGRRTPIVDWTYLLNKCGIIESNCETLSIDYSPTRLLHKGIRHECVKFQGYPVNITTATWELIYSSKKQVTTEFQWKPEIKKLVGKKMGMLRRRYKTIVGVHVRRTDYYTYLNDYYGKFYAADANYYNKTMNYFREKYADPIFLIFSDDMKWCRKHILGFDVVYTGNEKQIDPGQDLALLSSCDHLILSYGTFGMMAAWFNNGEVVAADNFTGRPEAMVEALKNTNSIKWKWMSV